MSDFETHPVGTRLLLQSYMKEIELSRALARAIEVEMKSYGPVIPHSVLKRYNELKKHYEQQMEEGLM
ncbi:hypothetical protein EBT25_05780 [bacterium]|nr:hypothetical protein [bacterium]